MILIKNTQLYAPDNRGKQDIFIAGGKVIAIANDLSCWQQAGVTVINGEDFIAVPGFVDTLVHFTGGGGEGGFDTRTPELDAQEAIQAGVTTLIGALGTDAVTQSIEALVAKTKALKLAGLSAYCYTGSYHLPVVTLTGDVQKDIMFVDEIIGLGEVAIADHRSSQLTMHQLAQASAQARVGGMLAGKAGIVSIHVGDAKDKLSLLEQVCADTSIPIQQFYPTHINRSHALFDAGISYAQKGGYLDFTTSTNEQILASGEIAAPEALAKALNSGIAPQQLTMSSDANASLPLFNQQGELIQMQRGKISSLHQAFVSAVNEYNVPFETALASISQNPAAILKLAKGKIAEHGDADIILLNRENLAIEKVIANGKLLYTKE